MKDKRESPRIDVDILVNYSTNATARAKNISETGICLIADKPFKIDSYLTLVFALPSDREIKVYAKVIWFRQVDIDKLTFLIPIVILQRLIFLHFRAKYFGRFLDFTFLPELRT